MKMQLHFLLVAVVSIVIGTLNFFGIGHTGRYLASFLWILIGGLFFMIYWAGIIMEKQSKRK